MFYVLRYDGGYLHAPKITLKFQGVVLAASLERQLQDNRESEESEVKHEHHTT